MKTLKVFQIPVVEWILVVPLDLQGESGAIENFHVIDFMGDGFFLNAIHDFSYLKAVFLPASIGEIFAETLSQLPFATTTANQLFRRNPNARESLLQFRHCTAHIVRKNRFGVVQRENLKAFLS